MYIAYVKAHFFYVDCLKKYFGHIPSFKHVQQSSGEPEVLLRATYHKTYRKIGPMPVVIYSFIKVPTIVHGKMQINRS